MKISQKNWLILLIIAFFGVASGAGAEVAQQSQLQIEQSPLATSTLPVDASLPKLQPAVKFEGISNSDKSEMLHREERVGFSTRTGISNGISYYGANADNVHGQSPFVRYTGYRANATFDVQANRQWFFTLLGGATKLTLHEFLGKSYDNSRTLPLWRARAVYTPIAGTELRLEGNNDFAYAGWLDNTDSYSQVMAQNIYFAEIESSSIEHWQLRTNAKLIKLEDTNQQLTYDHQIMRDVVLDPFILRAGVGGGWFRYRDQWPGYWNPSYFEVYQLRVVAIKSLSKSWSTEARYAYGYHREIGRLRGEENAGELHLRYRSSSNWVVNLKGTFLDSENGGWWKNEYGLFVEAPL